MTKKDLIDLYDRYKEAEHLRIQLCIHMPDGSTEMIYNMKAHDKVEYIMKTYDDKLRHKNNENIYITDVVFYYEGNINFGTALYFMRFFGLRAARRSWNGKAWVYFVPKGNYTPVTIAAKLNLDDQGKVPYGAYLAIKQQDDIVYPFTPGQDSILADDWYLLD